MKTFEAHGHTWTEHTPGDPMPCAAKAEVYTNWRCEIDAGLLSNQSFEAEDWDWGPMSDKGEEIIGWRHATKEGGEG